MVRRFHIPWSIQYQMMLPLLAIVAWFVFRQVSNSSVAAWEMLDRKESEIPKAVATEAPESPAAVTRNWLNQLELRYPGWKFVTVERGLLSNATVALTDWNRAFLAQLPAIVFEPDRQRDFVLFDEEDEFWVAPIPVPRWPADTRLIGLQSRQFAFEQDASLGALFESYGALVIVALIGSGAWFASRLSRRVIRIQQQIRRVAAGDLNGAVDDRGNDEVAALARSVNTMVRDLADMRSRIQSVERTRLHSQIANGIAHELRNGIHVASLSLQMFQDKCRKARSALPAESMIATAADQLTITEALVRRLLALGKPQQRDRVSKPLSAILEETLALLRPMFQHAEVELAVEAPASLQWNASDAESFQAAVLNLCLNAIEAAGRGGKVRVTALSHPDDMELQVADSGPGPAESVAGQLFEPFVSTKPEGIGLGLVLVRQAIEDEGGTVRWHRDGEWTVFSIRAPHDAPSAPVERTAPETSLERP